MKNVQELRIHVQTTHDNVRVNLLNEKELIRIRCEKCEYECRYNKQLKKDIKNEQEEDDD